MREWLSFSNTLDEPIPNEEPGKFKAALEAALKRIEQGVPIEEAGVPELPDEAAYPEDLEVERERMLRAFGLACEASRSPR